MRAETHTMSYYRELERKVFSRIPGVTEIESASPEERDRLSGEYPDAAFVLMIADNLLCGVRGISTINQKAYLAILCGEEIANVRFRHTKEMDDYFARHGWDD